VDHGAHLVDRHADQLAGPRVPDEGRAVLVGPPGRRRPELATADDGLVAPAAPGRGTAALIGVQAALADTGAAGERHVAAQVAGADREAAAEHAERLATQEVP